MGNDRYDTGGLAFVILLILGMAYCYFVIYELGGNFKTCDSRAYPLQSICFEEEIDEQL